MTGETLDNVRRQPVDAATQARFEKLLGRALAFVSAEARDHYVKHVDIALIVSSLDAVALRVGHGTVSRVVAVPRHRVGDLRDPEALFTIAWDIAAVSMTTKDADRACRKWGFTVPRRCSRKRHWPVCVTINARGPEPSR